MGSASFVSDMSVFCAVNIYKIKPISKRKWVTDCVANNAHGNTGVNEGTSGSLRNGHQAWGGRKTPKTRLIKRKTMIE
jgi:hypothetical protein